MTEREKHEHGLHLHYESAIFCLIPAAMSCGGVVFLGGSGSWKAGSGEVKGFPSYSSCFFR